MSVYNEILKNYWGHDTFRPLQEEAIRDVCRGRDVLVLMPTGGGKSIVYQLPALVLEGICVVITPLIALMKDQTDALRRRGILSVSIHSGMTPRQIDTALDNCIYGDYKFLYVSPERIDSELFRTRFAKMKVSLIAVDEAHCISQWGFDFRPSYLKIARLRGLAPNAPILALTASATPRVAEDIFTYLEFQEKNIIRSGFARENLSYVVRHTENKPEHMLRVMNNVAGSGIVYVRTREKAEQIARFLNENGITADFYHGGLAYVQRGVKQDEWLKGRCRVMVATNAFGMGIDKPGVRFVIHYDMCDSLESYYQEAGRAGRDGRTAYAVLLVSAQDKAGVRKRLELEYPPPEQIRKVYDALFNYFQIAVGDGKGQAQEFNLFDFSAKNRFFPPMALNAVKILQLNGYLALTDEADHPPRVMFSVSREDLYKIRVEKEELDYFIKVLLRSYTGLFSDFVRVNLNEISYLSGYTLDKVNEYFKRLWQWRIIKYIPGSRSSLILFTEERLPAENVRISPESYKFRKKMAEGRLEAMAGYATNDSECRSLVLQRYFGDVGDTPCGVCDVCRSLKNNGTTVNNNTVIKERILSLLNDGWMDFHELVSQTGGEVNSVLKAVKSLAEEGKIEHAGQKLKKV